MQTIISFLSDFGLTDTSVGQCKAVIAGISPKAAVIDITHAIPHYDITTGAWLLHHAVPHFPPCLHVAVVDPGVGTPRRAIAIECERGDVLIGPDNGLLLPAAEILGGITSVVELVDPQFRHHPVSNTFHGRDIFSPAAAHLIHGVTLHLLGPRIDPGGLVSLDHQAATVTSGVIHTGVASINEFGSLALTAPADLLADIGSPSRVHFEVNGASHDAQTVSTFGEAPVGGALLLVDSYGYLCLAINQESLAGRLGLARTDHPIVTIEARGIGGPA
ncbi:MAG TPA: SAM-dependent chlorinase/fluorinase [Chloroflexota bacterium]|nr:SAM-dependent chlorinase/fluorinase [Chloroflexota bacterium]